MTDTEIALTVHQLKRATELISELSKMQLQNLELIAELMRRVETLERRVNQ